MIKGVFIKMHWTIGKKMLLTGVLIVIGLSIMGGNAYRTNSAIQKVTDLTTLRNEQLGILNKMIQSHSELMLAALDSIVDKDEGKIDAERMDNINASVAFINRNLGKLVDLADTDEEKRSAQEIGNLFPKLAKGIQQDLKGLIEKKADDAEYAKVDDILDEYGDQMSEGLTQMVASVQEEQKEAAEASSSLIANSTWFGLAVFFITLGIIVPLFLFITRSVTKPLGRAIEGLTASADQVASASRQVSSSSQHLAEGSSDQAASIEETSSSLEEMSSMTKQNADHAKEANNLMSEANQVVGQANESMSDLTVSMDEITKASEETSKIIKTIDEIAFQTNLLALNAAVEAARAGEAGSGFAVVADEVRNLAMRAADAAKNTAGLIEGTVKKVKDGADLVTRTNEAFTKVSESSGKVGELVAEIDAASNEQAQGIGQVNTAVNEMDKVVQQNAANAEESASASEEMNAQAEQMKSIVAEMATLVGGSGSQAGSGESVLGNEEHVSMSKVRQVAGKARAATTQAASAKSIETAKPVKELKPDDVIPLDEDDFKDF